MLGDDRAKRFNLTLVRSLHAAVVLPEQDHGISSANAVRVVGCPFHNYFWNVGRSNVTPILCAWDTAWQTEVNRSPKRIRVDIRSTIASGAAVCEFTFRKPGPVGAE